MRTQISFQWLKLATFALVACAIALQAHAQASRTWVSGVGDDANPCSRTAPCKTFAGALSRTAPNGEINVLDSAGYGAVTITKAITINGEGANASILSALTNGINVAAGASDTVILRHIEINGVGNGIHGINFISGGTLVVDHVVVYGVTQNGISFTPPASSRLVVNDSIFRDNGGSGIQVTPGGSGAANVTLDHVTLNNNARGIRIDDNSRVFIARSMASFNTNNGFVANGVARVVEVTIESSTTYANGAAGVFSGGLSTVRISRVNSSGNPNGLVVSGTGQIVSAGNNAIIGNTTNGAPTSTSPEI